MTNDANIILEGLKCCAHNHPLCDICPYNKDGVNCIELEKDAANKIKELLTPLNGKEEV